jgi:hypothetical protein
MLQQLVHIGLVCHCAFKRVICNNARCNPYLIFLDFFCSWVGEAMRMVSTLVFPLDLQSVLQLRAISGFVTCIVAKFDITFYTFFSLSLTREALHYEVYFVGVISY